MRRLFPAIALLIICTVVLAGCGSKEMSLYEAACKKYNGAAGVTISFTSNFGIDDGSGKSTEGVFTGTYMLKHEDGKVTAAHLSGTINVNTGAAGIEPVMIDTYYAGGRLYAVMSGSKYFTAMDWEHAQTLIGPAGELLTGLAETDLREITMTEDGDTKKLAFTLTSKAAESIPGLKEEWRRIADLNNDEETILSIDALTGSIVTAKKEPVSQSISYAGSIRSGERTIIVRNTIEATYSYAEVDIQAPAEAEYKELNK